MKLTSYEISKKLKEAGFEAETDFYWYCYDKGQEMRHIADADGKGNVKSYDLETILDALPDFIIREYKSKENGEVKEFKENLKINKDQIYYIYNDIENADDANYYYQEYDYMSDICVFKKFDEKSLADTAGRLLIKLYEAGIINFKK